MVSYETHLLSTPRFDVVEVPAIVGEPNGKMRQIVRHPGAVTIIPLVDEDHVCLIRNYRVSVDKVLIELPAGTREPDEEAIITAERELIEETGYRCQNLEFLHRFLLSPGILDEQMYLFVATGLTAGSPAREEGEEIDNLVVTWQQAIDWVFSGEIKDAKTITGLLMFDHLRENR
jgi:ADP-ribose pyrophosphatase